MVNGISQDPYSSSQLVFGRIDSIKRKFIQYDLLVHQCTFVNPRAKSAKIETSYLDPSLGNTIFYKYSSSRLHKTSETPTTERLQRKTLKTRLTQIYLQNRGFWEGLVQNKLPNRWKCQEPLKSKPILHVARRLKKRALCDRSGNFNSRTIQQGESRHWKLTSQRACCEPLANQSERRTKAVKFVFINRES